MFQKKIQLKRIKEIMYCNFLIDKKFLLSLSSRELENLINQKLLDASKRAFIINKYFRCTNNPPIKTSLKYIEDKSELVEINNSSLRVRIFEELDKTNASILIDNDLKDFELVINGDAYLEEIKDCAYEEPESFYTFFENKININSFDQQINYDLSSESYGKRLNKYLIIDSNKGGSSINLMNERISEYIEDFKYL